MITSEMHKQYFNSIKIIILSFFLLLKSTILLFAGDNIAFDQWKKNFKLQALKIGISNKTLESTIDKAKFLERVISYDRKQPEFIEPTNVYVGKRATNKRKKLALSKYKLNKNLITQVESKFKVEKEILLSLWGIETNFGRHVGKMDIISSLATLSFDKRRSKFFTSELLILLKLIDDKKIGDDMLYGSWAGAAGNFQFMPSTIKKYAIDFNNDGNIDLKNSLDDSFASAANYIKKMGWKYKKPCFYKVDYKNQIDKKFINFSAKKIHSKKTIQKWSNMGIIFPENFDLDKNEKVALIAPDGLEKLKLYIVFENYEKILKWNRSLRFAISVCTLSSMIKNEI